MKLSICSAALEKTEKVLIAFDTIFLAFVTVLVVIQVVARAFGIVLTGTEELARFTYVLFAFLAWPVAALKGTDLSVTILFDKLPSKLRHILLGIYHCIMATFACFVFVSAVKSINNVKGMVASGNTWFHMEWLYIGITIGISLTILFNLIRSYRLWIGLDVYLTQEEKDKCEIEKALQHLSEESEK